jgi:Phosphoribosyl transferase domain
MIERTLLGQQFSVCLRRRWFDRTARIGHRSSFFVSGTPNAEVSAPISSEKSDESQIIYPSGIGPDRIRLALDRLRCEKQLMIVPGATHLFEEPGTLEEVMRHAREWFARHLTHGTAEKSDPVGNDPIGFADRVEAARKLAGALLKYKDQHPVVLGIPRGGVPVAVEVAQSLDAEVDVIIVRKLGAAGQQELGIGAVVDGDHPETVMNQEVMSQLDVSREYPDREIKVQLKEINRRRRAYRGGRPPLAARRPHGNRG